MAHAKKGQLHQIVFPMVDSTDFASVKSAITASDFDSGATKKFYGWNTGSSAATTSGAISKAVSLVRSGVFRQTLKTTENNYDMMMCRFNKTGCAEQIIVWSNVDNDDSDLMSALTVIQSMASDAASAAAQGNSRILIVQSQASDAYSAIIAPLASMTSDVASAVWAHAIGARVDSRILVNKSVISDLYSLLSDVQSDFQSRVPKRVATDSQLSDLHSDLRSFLVVMSSIQSDILSAVSDMQSDFQSRVPKRVATDSQLSDIASDLRSVLVLNQSAISDIASVLSDLQSDFQSRVPKRVATDSQLSDMASDIKSAVSVGNSRVLLNQSRISDVQSFLSDFQSDLLSHLDTTGVHVNASDMSDLRSAITAITLTVSASDISDIASAVIAGLALTSDVSDILSAARQINSRVLVVQSQASDVYSAVIAPLASMTSDIASAVWAHAIGTRVDSRILVNKSAISDIYSMLSDVQSDFQSRVPKRVATDSQLSDLTSDVKSAVTVVLSLVSDVQSQVAAGVELGASSLSDLRSAILAGPTDVQLNASSLSDIRSAIASPISASDLSDIASAVRTIVSSDLSDILSSVTAIKAKTDNLPVAVKKNTALANFEFPLVLSSDHVTGATGKTVTATRSIDGGGFAACANAVSEISSGIYKISLAAADLNGDTIMLRFAAASCDDRFVFIATQS